MLKKKRSKVTRMRGSSSHGWGAKKKHRGKGHRGGVGMAGTGARGDAKKPTILKEFGKSYYGKRGFKSLNNKKNKVLSLAFVESSFDKLVEAGVVGKEGNEFVLDVKKAGYDKVLGNGVLTKKITFKCDFISNGAKEKIEGAGGKVVLTGKTE